MDSAEKTAKLFIENEYNITLKEKHFEPLGNVFPDFGYKTLAFEVTQLYETNKDKTKISKNINYAEDLYDKITETINEVSVYNGYGYLYRLRKDSEYTKPLPAFYKITQKIKKEFNKKHLDGNKEFKIDIFPNEDFKLNRQDFKLKKENGIEIVFYNKNKYSKNEILPYPNLNIKNEAFYQSIIIEEIKKSLDTKNIKLNKFIKDYPERYIVFNLILVNCLKINLLEFKEFVLAYSIIDNNKFKNVYIIDNNANLIVKLV